MASPNIDSHWLDRASMLFKQQAWSSLRALCKEVLLVSPAEANATYLLGLSYFEEDPELASDYLKQALAIMPQHPDYLRQMGHLLRRKGDYREALVYYLKVTELQPLAIDAWLNLTKIQMYSGDLNEAEQSLLKAQKLQPRNKRVLQTEALFCEKKQFWSRAQKLYQHLIDQMPTEPNNWLGLMRSLKHTQTGQVRALKWEEAMQFIPMDGALLEQRLAFYLEQENSTMAENCLRTPPPQPTANWMRLAGYYYLLVQDLESAERSFLKIAETDKLFPDRLKGLAEVALKRKNWREACELYQQSFLQQRGQVWSECQNTQSQPIPQALLPASISKHKLEHDLMQWHFLAEKGLLPERAQLLLPEYESFVNEHQVTELFPNRSQSDFLQKFYDRPVSLICPAVSGAALNPALDFEALQDRYLNATTPLLWFDEFLSAESLSALREFCLCSSLWRDYYAQEGYLGAFMDDGFISPLLMAIARELSEAFPLILGSETLNYVWGFKYGENSQGIRLHADKAKINLNFWLTPDSANNDPESGGLLVYNAAAPSDWDFKDYNDQNSLNQIQAFLAQQKAKQIQIAHRQNRAVLFNSRLFHQTDTPHFKPGYENQRINVTMLFG
jgi:tetratricopeptide (TPR) repeat protein